MLPYVVGSPPPRAAAGMAHPPNWLAGRAVWYQTQICHFVQLRALRHPAAMTDGSSPMLAYAYMYINSATGIRMANSAKQKPDNNAGIALNSQGTWY